MFQVSIKDTDLVSVSLLPTLNICLKFKNLGFIQKCKMIKTRTIKIKSTENEETVMAKRMIEIIMKKQQWQKQW